MEVIKQVRAGCAPACIAMVLGRSYESVLSDFHNDFLDDGQDIEQTMDYLSDFGVSIIRKEVRYYCGDVKFGRDELLKPFAPIHIVRVKEKFDSTTGHLVVMDESGKLFCPLGQTEEEIKNSYVITTVLGLYK
jgi:hypothetical protein